MYPVSARKSIPQLTKTDVIVQSETTAERKTILCGPPMYVLIDWPQVFSKAYFSDKGLGVSYSVLRKYVGVVYYLSDVCPVVTIIGTMIRVKCTWWFGL